MAITTSAYKMKASCKVYLFLCLYQNAVCRDYRYKVSVKWHRKLIVLDNYACETLPLGD